MYMNKTKRNLIIAGAVLNLVVQVVNLVMSILLKVNQEAFKGYEDYHYLVSVTTTNLVMSVISCAVGVVASVLLLYCVRSKGKYYRQSMGMFYTGFVLVIFFGGWLSWLLLFIATFVPDVIVMNTKSEVKREEVLETKEMEEKKKRIDDLKRLRDAGIITEEEYKEKLFELL